MISLTKTDFYKNLQLKHHHANLFYSSDALLTEAVALNFAKSLVCENDNMCNYCSACKQFEIGTNPDVTIIKQASIKVADVSSIINKLNTKPINSEFKLIVILNADTINETAQNKLLKSLEEPNPSTIFVLTTTKTDKLLPTILSRLNKIYVPAPNTEDKKLIAEQFSLQGTNLDNYPLQDCTLTEAVEIVTDSNYLNTIDAVFDLLFTLRTTADIPRAVAGLENIDKNKFFYSMQDIFLNLLNNKNKYGEKLNQLKPLYPKNCLPSIVPLIDEAYKKQQSNVNFTFILDNLLFDILKEKFLCK